MKRLSFTKVCITAAAVLAATVSFPATAAIVTYSGADNAVSSLAAMTNSQAAAASFDAAVPGASRITFDSAVPADVTISGGSITSVSGCGALCGFNTTPAGSMFLLLHGGSTTFSFANPIDAFGVYITGLQTDLVPQETLTFSDGSSRAIDTPASVRGGGAFLGFTDFGASIVSVTYNATNDIVALDDVRYDVPNATVPEPATLGLLGLGLAGIGFARRRKAR